MWLDNRDDKKHNVAPCNRQMRSHATQTLMISSSFERAANQRLAAKNRYRACRRPNDSLSHDARRWVVPHNWIHTGVPEGKLDTENMRQVV